MSQICGLSLNGLHACLYFLNLFLVHILHWYAVVIDQQIQWKPTPTLRTIAGEAVANTPLTKTAISKINMLPIYLRIQMPTLVRKRGLQLYAFQVEPPSWQVTNLHI